MLVSCRPSLSLPRLRQLPHLAHHSTLTLGSRLLRSWPTKVSLNTLQQMLGSSLTPTLADEHASNKGIPCQHDNSKTIGFLLVLTLMNVAKLV